MALWFSLFLAPALLVPSTSEETPLVALNRLDGIVQTYFAASPRRLEVLTAKEASSDGDGATLFGGRSPVGDGNEYFGIMVPLNAPLDLRERALSVDARTLTPDHCAAFYIRLYNQGESKPAWSFQSWSSPLKAVWSTFRLQQGQCLGGLSWEESVVEERVADRVDRVEFIIGTSADDVDVIAVVDNLRIAPRIPSIEELREPKRLVRDTIVVQEGVPAAVVLHPDTDAGRAAAHAIMALVREKTGVEIPARVGTPADRQPDQTTFFVGNVFTNPAMLLLYARYMTPVDAICPGTRGALVHTVFDPFGKGVNGIVVGASDDAGLAKAVELLRGVVAGQSGSRSLVLPRIFERAYGEDFLAENGWADDAPAEDRLEKGLAEGQKALDEGKHTSIAGVLANVAQRYQFTGHSVEAQLFVRLWDLYAKSAVDDPRKFGGPWGFDSDFPSGLVVPGWRNVESDLTLTDEERLATTKAMSRWLREAVVPSCAGAAGSNDVPHNHQTFPTLGTLFAGLYFTEGFSLAEGETWLGIADAIFQRQATYFKPYEDCNGYQWLTNGHLMRYTVARPDFAFYENGNARKVIDYCIGNMDNLGYQVPYGDTGSWQCWDSETICLDIFRFVTADPAAAWASSLKHTVKKSSVPYGFQSRGAHEVPARYDGVRVWELEPAYYDTHRADKRPALAQCFDKVSFRASLDPQDAYLLLDGLSNGGHKHFDGNSIPRLTQFGRIWLADNDYYKSAVKYHNSMMVFRDGQSAQIPAYTELLGAGETPRYGFCQSRVNDFAGADWERTVVWLKELEAFVVLDRLTAREANEYQFRVLWHGVGTAELRPEGLLLEQRGPSMWIQVAPGPELRLQDDTELGSNWSGYAFAEPVVRSMSGIAAVRLPEGGSYLFASVLHGAAEGRAAPWTVAHAEGGDGVVLDTGTERLVIGLSLFRMPAAQGALATDARVVVADQQGFSLLGATRADAGGQVYHRSADAQSADVKVPGTRDLLKATGQRSPMANLGAGAGAPAHKIAWQVNLPEKARTVNRIAVAHLDGQPQPPSLLAATQEGALLAYSADGNIRWNVALGCPLNDVIADDLNGDGKDEIVVGRQDHMVSVLDQNGAEVWSRKIEYYRKPPYVNVVRTGDLDGDGTPEVVIGGENWRFYAFKADGTELWNYESVHPSRSGAVADLDGDGRAEVICGTHYYWLSALNPDGTRRWGYSFGPIAYDVTTGSFDGDATRGVVCGGGDGCVHYVSSEGKLRMKYDTGDEVKAVRAVDLDGDGRDEMVAASWSHNVYAFGADGQRRWRVDLGAPVTALAVGVPNAAVTVEAGTAQGKVVTLDKGGAPLASTELDSGVCGLVAIPGCVVAATKNGQLVGLAVP